MSWLKLNKPLAIILVLAVIFFIVYSFFTFTIYQPLASDNQNHWIYSWPDAMANSFFIEHFIKTSNLQAAEPLNQELQGIIHPRSVNIVSQNLVPLGFIGQLLIYGFIGKLISFPAIIYLTPFLASLSVVLYFLILKKIFNKQLAFLSSLLLFTLAPFVYYANLPFLSAICFISLTLLCLTFFIYQNSGPTLWSRCLFSGLAGFFLAWALTVRPIEFPWLMILLLVPLIFNWREIKLWPTVSFIIAGFFPLLILLYYNQQTYGQFLSVGYLQMQDPTLNFLDRLPVEFEQTASNRLTALLKLLFLPFGFHPRIILLNLKYYLVLFLAPYVAAFFLGTLTWLIHWWKNQTTPRERIYALTAGLVSLYLIIYYGSWLFIDPLVLKNNTIGSSYVRYWLPIYLLMIPVIGYLFQSLLKIKSVHLGFKSSLVAIIIIVLTIFSFNLTYLTPGDGLLDQNKTIQNYYAQANIVNSLIEKEAIIISDRADKLFFPQRPVIMFDLNYAIFPIIARQLPTKSFYYYTLMPDKDINYINERKIKELNLQLTEPQTIDSQFRLFKLIPLK